MKTARWTGTVLSAALLLATLAHAQVEIYVPDNATSSGTCNVIPFGQSSTFSAAYTYVGRVPASFLDPLNTGLQEIAFTPCSSGTWSCSTVIMAVGHIPPNLGTPFTFPDPTASPMFLGSFLDLTVIWDSAAHGPFSWSVTQDTWSPMGFQAQGGTPFAWDGQNDVGFFVTYQSSTVSGWNGAFHRTGTEPFRWWSSGFLPPSSSGSGNSGLKMRFTMVPFSPPPPPYVIDVSSTGAGDATLSITGIPSGTFSGWTFISSDTAAPVGTGPHFGITADALTLSIFLTYPSPTPGHPLHWIAGLGGVFPSVPLSLPPGTMTPFSGQTWDFVSLGQDLGGTITGNSNVDRVTW